MGRKSMKEARKDEILRALARSIVKHGVDVPLDAVADEAGMPRGLIRHHGGNRDELMAALVDRVTATYRADVEAAFSRLGTPPDPEAFLDVLLDSNSTNADWDGALLELLAASRTRSPQGNEGFRSALGGMLASIEPALSALRPQWEPDRRRSVAYSLFCLVVAHEVLGWAGIPLVGPDQWRSSARLLLPEPGTS